MDGTKSGKHRHGHYRTVAERESDVNAAKYQAWAKRQDERAQFRRSVWIALVCMGITNVPTWLISLWSYLRAHVRWTGY